MGVVVFDVSGDRLATGGKLFRAVRSEALLLETANEPLAQLVVPERVGGEIF